jgi:branched-chain amino acid transport system ATP-binding protein
VKAVDGVDIELDQKEILGLIGPNGAGKTTLVNAISGFQSLTEGPFSVGGRDVTGWRPHKLAKIGLTRTFQNVRPFSGLTVLDNVELGGVGVGMSRRAARSQAWEILERLGLMHLAYAQASALPHGDERRLSIARALATKPRFLLLDEPAAGLNELESDELVGIIASIRSDSGCGVLVIEHDMRLIMGVCERIQVLDYGQTISTGSPDEIQSDQAVITAYLGTRRSKRVAGA